MSATEPWSDWIDVSVILDLYSENMSRYGGFPSHPVPGCVESALGAAYSAESYSMPDVDEETVISGLTFSGYILYYLAINQCWTDGSKRAAWASATWVLSMMGLAIDCDDQEAIDYCMSIAKKEISSGEEVVNWIAERLIELP